METIRITELTVSGFRNFRGPVCWKFGRTTLICGHNAVGKSSIADAIAFALTGAPFFGGRGLDELHHPDCDSLSAELRFMDEQARPHILLRTRKDGNVQVSLDGTEMPQKRISELLGGKDLVLSLLNPLYFAEVLGADGRKLLEQLVPMPTPEAVRGQLSAHMCDILGDDKLLQPETYLKNRRAELQELERDLLYLSGQKNANDRQRAEIGKQIADQTAELARLHAALAVFEPKRTAGVDMEQLEQEIARLGQQLFTLDRTPTEQARQLEDQIHALEESEFVSAQAGHIELLKAELVRMYQQHARLTKLADKMTIGTCCPTCRRVIDKQSAPIVREAYRKQLESVVARGTELRGQYDRAIAEEQAEREHWQQEKDVSLRELNRKMQQNVPQNSEAAQESLKKQIKALSRRELYGALSDDEAKRYQALYDRQASLREEVETLNGMLDRLPVSEEEAVHRLEQQISAAREKIAAAQAYNAVRTEMMFEPLRMQHAQIVLAEPVKKTGEQRDVFKLTYCGRPYVSLSLSEKVRCGVEIVNMLGRLSGKCYPLFVDNAESICDLGACSPSGQLILARMQKGQALSVRALDAPVRKAG